MSASVQQRGVSRVLTKLDNSIESGHYYEAHQMYRTLYFRYTAQEKYSECLDLLYNGALKLIDKDQNDSAVDLGLLIVNTLEKRGPADEFKLWLERLVIIISRLGPYITERDTLINRAIKWSSDVVGKIHGEPKLHNQIAQILWSEDNIEQARQHFVLCQDGDVIGHILAKMSMTKGLQNEIDLFVVQGVLQQLCLKDLKTAKSTFKYYCIYHSEIDRKEAPFKQPLLNFIFYLFRCIDIGRLESFRVLCDLYKPSLKKDPSFDKYLLKIGVLFFGATPPPSNSGGIMGGMFGDMFSRLLQGFEDDDDNDNTQNNPENCVTNNELD